MVMHMAEKKRVAVAGASGYAGGEVLRLLLAHPDVEIGALTGASNAGQPLGVLQPHLVPLADRVLEETTVEVLSGHDVVFLALPHGESGAVAARLGDDVVVVDCGADFRLTDQATWERFYGGQQDGYAGSWPYGLPELPGQREPARRRDPDRGPGLLPDGLHAGPRPGRRRRAGRRRRPGGGRGLRHQRRRQGREAPPARLGGDRQRQRVRRRRHAPAHPRDRAEPLRPHRPAEVRVSFTPMLVPMSRGILATCSAPTTADAAEVRAAYDKAYGDEPFVHLLPEGQWPQTKSVIGSNAVHLQVTVDEAAGRLVAVGAVDNLAKGTGGAAVQCMNLALGLPETTGLSTVGLAP